MCENLFGNSEQAANQHISYYDEMEDHIEEIDEHGRLLTRTKHRSMNETFIIIIICKRKKIGEKKEER